MRLKKKQMQSQRRWLAAGATAVRIADIHRLEIVFRKVVGYSSEKLFGAVRGLAGVQ